MAARVAVAAARRKDVDTAAGVGAAAGGGASGPSSSRRSSSSRSRDEGGEGVRASASGADMVGGRAWATRRSPFSFEAQRVPGSAARGQHRSSHRHSLYLRTAQFTVRPFFSHHAFSPHRIHQGPFSLGQKSESSGLRGPLPPASPPAIFNPLRPPRHSRSISMSHSGHVTPMPAMG